MGAETNKKPQLHQSMLGQISRCQIQFGFRHGETFGIAPPGRSPENIIIPPGVAAATGTALHCSAELNLQRRIDTGQPAPREEVVMAAHDSVDGAWESGMWLPEGDEGEADNLRRKSTDMAVRLAQVHYDSVAPRIVNPVAVEQKFVMEDPNSPFDLAGTKDVVEIGGTSSATTSIGVDAGREILHDTKTAAFAPGVDACKTTQMYMYSLETFVRTGELPVRVHIDCLQKLKNVRVHLRSDTPTMEWLSRIRARIAAASQLITAVQAGHVDLMPCDPEHQWACTKKYCGYHKLCQYWSGR